MKNLRNRMLIIKKKLIQFQSLLKTCQNQNSIPPTKQGFKTKLKGNTTSHVPPGKIKVVIDPHVNYNGQPKAQEMVKEITDVIIDSKDIKVDKNVTSYLQQQHHHDEITK